MPNQEDTSISFNVSEDAEYFLCIAQHGIHSFIMLGVIADNEEPQLLARVGKSTLTSTLGCDVALGKSVPSSLADEGLMRDENHIARINYQAYSITLEQTTEFLKLLAYIDKETVENEEFKEAVEAYNKKVIAKNIVETKQGKKLTPQFNLHFGIKAQVPFDNKDGKVYFKYQMLEHTIEEPTDSQKAIAQGVNKLTLTNTCRQTAKKLIKEQLGFSPDVSAIPLITPRHKTWLCAGRPEKSSFYILPLPPNTLKLDAKQDASLIRVLNNIYRRLEQIPKLKPGDQKTRAKFESLKALYKGLAGQPQLNIAELLEKIKEHETKNRTVLYEKRSPGIFSRLFSCRSSTEKEITAITKQLLKEKKEEEKKSPPLPEPPTNSCKQTAPRSVRPEEARNRSLSLSTEA